MPSSVLHPSLCLFFLLIPFPCCPTALTVNPPLASPSGRRWTQGSRLCIKRIVPRRSAATFVCECSSRHVLCRSLYRLYIISVSLCHLCVCFSVPYALVSLGATVHVCAPAFVCLCVVTPSVLRRLCCSLPGLLSSSEGRGGIKKTDLQQIPSLSLTHRPQATLFISGTHMPQVISGGECF